MRLLQTCPDKPDDFTVEADDDCAAGRIQFAPGTTDNQKPWQWYLTILDPAKSAISGFAETRGAAMAALKAMWEPYRDALTLDQWATHRRMAKQAEDARNAYERSEWLEMKRPGPIA